MITDDEALHNFSTNLSRLLAERRISQSELARRTGQSQVNISNLCNGQYLPGVAASHRIAEALETSIELLLAPPKKSLSRAS